MPIQVEVMLWCAAVMVGAGTFHVIRLVIDRTVLNVLGAKRVAMWHDAWKASRRRPRPAALDDDWEDDDY